MWPHYNLNTPFSTRALFKVMLHNFQNQLDATSHCISVLIQLKMAPSRRKTKACLPFFFNIPLQMRFITFHIHCWQKEMTLLPSSWHSGKGHRVHRELLPPSQEHLRTYDSLSLHILLFFFPAKCPQRGDAGVFTEFQVEFFLFFLRIKSASHLQEADDQDQLAQRKAQKKNR